MFCSYLTLVGRRQAEELLRGKHEEQLAALMQVFQESAHGYVQQLIIDVVDQGTVFDWLVALTDTAIAYVSTHAVLHVVI